MNLFEYEPSGHMCTRGYKLKSLDEAVLFALIERITGVRRDQMLEASFNQNGLKLRYLKDSDDE
jgi:hypothetical protein